MSLEAAKAATLPIMKDLTDVIGDIIPPQCRPSEAKDAYQFECRAIRLQGFLMAYGAPAKQIDAISALIADASEDEDLLSPPPISGIFPLAQGEHSPAS